MRNDDLVQFAKTLNAAALMKGKPMTTEIIELWWQMHQDWTIEDFTAAMHVLLKREEFMPQPNHFEDLRRQGSQTAGEVFAGVSQWLEYSPHGYKLKAETPRRIYASIMAIGGPQALAMCESEKLPFLERRFCDHYDQIGEAMEIREALPQLTGAVGVSIAYASGGLKQIGKR